MSGLLFFWIVIAGVTITIDIITSAFLFIWFSVGALSAAIALLLGYGFSTQLIIFIIISGVCMLIGYPLVKKSLNKTVGKLPTREESFVGREIIAESDINEKSNIKIDGTYWTVINQGSIIGKGDKFSVIGIDGNKLLIKKI